MSHISNFRPTDGWFLSGEPHEEYTFRRVLRAIHYEVERTTVEAALRQARHNVDPKEGRQKLKAEVARILAGSGHLHHALRYP